MSASPQQVAIVIGQNCFPAANDLHDLAYSEADATALERLLASGDETHRYDRVVRVCGGAHHDVFSQLDDVLSTLSRDDLAFVYYSGHGLVDRRGRLHLAFENTNEDRLASTAIKVADVLDVMHASSARQRLLMLDCCYAGAVGAEFNRSGLADQVGADAQGSGTIVIAATTKLDVAKENPDYGHGVFTKHVLDGLAGSADRDESGAVTAQELYDYVHRQVTSESQQKPLRYNLETEGQIVLRRTGLTPWRDRADTIRQSLFQLAAEQNLSNLHLGEALPLLSIPPSEMSPEQSRRYALLREITPETFRSGPFADQWHATREPSKPPTAGQTGQFHGDHVTVLGKRPGSDTIDATELPADQVDLTRKPKKQPKYPDPQKVAQVSDTKIPARPPPDAVNKGFGYQTLTLLGFLYIAFVTVILIGIANGGSNSIGLVIPVLFGSMMAVFSRLARYSLPFAIFTVSTGGFALLALLLVVSRF